MWNEPTEEELLEIPKMYATEDVDLEDKLIYMKFFLGSATWYMAEYDPQDRVFFGYANLGDREMAEWGYISYDELLELKVRGLEVDRDLYWKPKRFTDIVEP